MDKALIRLGGILIVVAALTGAAFADEEVDELTVIGKDRSVISGSALGDTRAGGSAAVTVDTTELQAGLTVEESQMDRQENKLEKPTLADFVRAKPDITPDHQYQIDWKLSLLIGLLESSKK